MDISAVTNASASASQSNGKTENPSEQRDLFMTLLVAQLKNQDPLAPQEGAEFVAQLAQFNSLDQLIGIRKSVDKLVLGSQEKTIF